MTYSERKIKSFAADFPGSLQTRFIPRGVVLASGAAAVVESGRRLVFPVASRRHFRLASEGLP
jgi:hypothetical protein